MTGFFVSVRRLISEALATVAGNLTAALAASTTAIYAVFAASGGAALIGFIQSAIGAAIRSLESKLFDRVSLLDFWGDAAHTYRVDPTGVLDSTYGIQSALDSLRPVHCPKGIYSSLELTLKDGSHLYGDGIEASIFKYTGTGLFLNAERDTDAFLPRTALYIEKIGFTGVVKGTQTGLSIKNRHDYAIRDCSFDHFSNLIKLEYAYLGLFENVNGTDCNTGWDIAGDINRVAFRSCGVTDFANYGVQIKPGTFGNLGLVFDNCDLEFGAGVCVRSEADNLIEFLNCYLGDGCNGNVFEIFSGKINVRGGMVLWGEEAALTHRLVEFVGANPTTDERSVTFDTTVLTGAAYCGIDAEKMVKGDGKIYIVNSGIATSPFWVGQAAVLSGNQLGSAPGINALPSNQGRLFTGAKTGTVTFAALPDLTSGSLFLTCTAAGGAGDIVYAHSALAAGKLLTYGAAGLIVVYKSNSDWGVNLSSGAFNTAPAVSLGGAVLESTGGTLKTLVVQGQYPLSAAYTTLEFLRQNCATNDFIEIYEVYLFDTRQYGTPGTLYAGKNLFKPV